MNERTADANEKQTTTNSHVGACGVRAYTRKLLVASKKCATLIEALAESLSFRRSNEKVSVAFSFVKKSRTETALKHFNCSSAITL